MKNLIKKMVFGVGVLVAFPFFLFHKLNSLFFPREITFQGISQLMSLVPGAIGNYIRTGFYWLSLNKCSPECIISFGTLFSTPNCEIGRYVYIGANCIISDSVIENNVLIGSNVHILSGKYTHNFSTLDVPIMLQKGSRVTVRIGEDTWIGNGAIIMANVGKKCVIGAGSIVTKEIEDYSVAVGNPARVIKKRT
ncbi:MAG: acyltransferase [Thermodesulfobacteriota bacterium]|nr:acyltransferase [Thermodesulfobacteriota bacterium]